MSNADNPLERLLQPLLDAGVPGSVTRRQARHDELAERLDAGVDPDYIRQFENFHSMDHAEIYRIAQTISPVAMTTLAGEWAKLGKGFSLAISLGTVMIRDRIAQHWEGDAASAAATATARFGESAQQLCDAAQAVAEKLHIAAEVGERVKSSIPPPATPIPLPTAALNPVADADAARQAEAVRVQAVRVMEALYKPYYRDSGAAVPVLPPPYDATTGHSGGGSGSWSSGPPEAFGTRAAGSGSATGTATGGAAAGRPGEPVDDTFDTARLPTEGRGSGEPSGSDTSGGSITSTEPMTTPASTTPAAVSGGATTSGQPYGSSPYGSPSSGNGPSGGGGSGAYGGGGGGSSSPWAPGMAGGGNPAASSTSQPGHQGTAARNGGMRPMGMMPGMMSGSPRTGDEDRRVPGYLVTGDNGNELIGSIPDTAPPVLGVDPL